MSCYQIHVKSLTARWIPNLYFFLKSCKAGYIHSLYFSNFLFFHCPMKHNSSVTSKQRHYLSFVRYIKIYSNSQLTSYWTVLMIKFGSLVASWTNYSNKLSAQNVTRFNLSIYFQNINSGMHNTNYTLLFRTCFFKTCQVLSYLQTR